jgi:hypothetical protein
VGKLPVKEGTPFQDLADSSLTIREAVEDTPPYKLAWYCEAVARDRMSNKLKHAGEYTPFEDLVSEDGNRFPRPVAFAGQLQYLPLSRLVLDAPESQKAFG